MAAPSKEISYDVTLMSVFKGDEVALQQLVSLDILSVTYKGAVPDRLRAGATPTLRAQPCGCFVVTVTVCGGVSGRLRGVSRGLQTVGR